MSETTEVSGGMSRAWRLSVRSKFLLMMLLTSLLSLGVITYLAYQSGKEAITKAAVNQLTSIRVGKKQQVETYFANLRLNIRRGPRDVRGARRSVERLR